MKKRLLMRNRRGAARRGVGFSFAVLIGMSTLLGFASQIISPQSALAETRDGSWVSMATIKIGSVTYRGSHNANGGKGILYVRENDPDKCNDYLTNFSDDSKEAELYIAKMDPANGCTDQKSTVKVKLSKSTTDRFIAFRWVDENKIERLNKKWSYTYNKTRKVFYQNEDACRDSIEVNSDKSTGKLIVRKKYSRSNFTDGQKTGDLRNDYNNYPFRGDIEYDKQINDCMNSKEVTVKLGDVDKAKEKGTKATEGTNVDPESSGGSTDNGASSDACGEGTGGGALRWILCPVVNAINEGIQWATDEVIGPSLSVAPLENGDTLYEAWKSIRNLANAFLVIIFLLIIFANFFASENSSYTVKKALPRLVAAAIFIQLSYFFCAILVDIGNVLGNGIGTLILQATGTAAGGTGATAGATLASSLLVGGGLVGGAVIATILGAWVLLLPLAIGLVISILTLILSLGVRIIALNLIIMLAPLALLAWVLPNTDKYFKMWITNLIKLILMYPMIIAIMAAAQVVVIVGAGNSSGDVKGTFTSVLTLFAPMIAFFMIPATFKMSGTVISGINGAIASKGKSFSNATAGSLRKNMGESIKKNSALKFGDPESGRIRRTAARIGMGVGTGFGAGAQSKMKRASAVAGAFKEKKDLLHHDYEEKGISGDNAAMMDTIFDKSANGGKGGFKPNVDSATRAAVMQMISENGGVEEMSAMYESLRANNDGKSYSQDWNHADRDLWNRGSATTRDKLAKSLPYAVRPDSDRSLGKMDAEGITGLKAAAGKPSKIDAATGLGDSHIESGLIDIARRASANAGDKVEGMSKPITQDQIDDAKKQQQKVLSSMVGIGQSTDRRGRVDAENIKALTRAAQAGLLGDAAMTVPGYDAPMNAKQIIAEFVDTSTGQLKVIPESNGSGPLKPPPVV